MSEQKRAFPGGLTPVCPRTGHQGPDEPGMTLRDYFAAKAMQAFLSSSEFENWHYERSSKEAYAVADLMLEARERAES